MVSQSAHSPATAAVPRMSTIVSVARKTLIGIAGQGPCREAPARRGWARSGAESGSVRAGHRENSSGTWQGLNSVRPDGEIRDSQSCLQNHRMSEPE